LANLIFSPYFTKEIGFHQHDSRNKGKGGTKPNDPDVLLRWYGSLIENNLQGVVFHNELSEEFMKKYPLITFENWPKQHRLSYNDERFFAYYQYLNQHPEIKSVFMTDLYDVQFFSNPFQLIEEHTDVDLFVGSETMSQYSSKWMRRKTKEMKIPLIENKYESGSTIYNAGIIGGRREEVLVFLKAMCKQLSPIPPKYNANMPVFNLVLEYLQKTLKYKIMTGFPLHNKFRSQKVDSGTYIKHK
jgi:hypothetical protein